MIAEKNNKPDSKTVHWLRCRLSFSLLRSAIMWLRGSISPSSSPLPCELNGPPLLGRAGSNTSLSISETT